MPAGIGTTAGDARMSDGRKKAEIGFAIIDSGKFILTHLSISDSLCVLTSVVTPCFSAKIRPSSFFSLSASSDEDGSSSMTSSPLLKKVRASAGFCGSPPDAQTKAMVPTSAATDKRRA